MEETIVSNIPVSKKQDLRQVWEIGILLFLFGTVFFILSKSVADPDLWGHVLIGSETLETGRIIRTDPYSYLTGDSQWINHEWLAEILFAVFWKLGGAGGLNLLKIAIELATFALLYQFLRKQGVPVLEAGILILLTVFLLIPAVRTVRVHMFMLLFFAVVLLVIYQAEHGGYAGLWIAPPAFLLWANLHGGFLSGLAMLGAWAFLHVVKKPRSILAAGVPAIASLAVTGLNPYGPRLWIFLLETLSLKFPEMSEWQPLQISSPLGAVYLLQLLLSITGLIYSQRRRRPALVILFGAAALLPFLAVRHCSLFAISALVLTSEHIYSAWLRIRPQKEQPRPVRRRIAFFPLALGLAMALLALPNLSKIELPGAGMPFPTRAVALIDQSQVKGNLIVQVDWGFYAIWHAFPNVKVSVDGRQQMAYSNRIYQENINFYYGVKDWDKILETPANLILVSRDSPASNLVELLDGWERIYADEVSSLFARSGSLQEEALRRTLEDFIPPAETEYFP